MAVSNMNSIAKMLLWLGLCFASAVIAQDVIQPSIVKETSEKHSNCGNEEVLFKIWAVLSNILDTDGTTKVPNRLDVEYALTLIKKTMLEYTDNQNVDVLQELFLREADLAKYKGVYLNDKRSLKNLLELELYPNDQNSKVTFKYELRSNDKPGCREAFLKLIQTSHQEFENLARSPVCGDNKYWLSTPNPISQIEAESLLYNNIYNNEVQFKANANPKGALRNTNPLLLEVNSVTDVKQKSAELSSLTKLLPLQAVELAKNPGYLLEMNFTEDLEHAKHVADEINKLYQTNKVQESQPFKVDLTPKQQLDTNLGEMKLPIVPSRFMKQLQPSYANQNPSLNFYQLYNKPNPVPESYTASNSIFVDSKYYPNLYQNYPQVQGIPNNVPVRNYENVLYPGKNILKTINQSYNYYSNPHENNTNVDNAEKIKNNYPYQPKVVNNAQNTHFNYYPIIQPIQETYKPQPSYSTGSSYDNLRLLPFNPYNNKLNGVHKFGYQSNHATVAHQFVQNIPQTALYKENKNNPYIVNTNIQYSTLSHVQNPNVPQHFIHQAANYNNGQPVIATLANWISETNPAKLNSNMENDKTEIELTYLVKKPPPVVYQPTTYFIKFRVPYKAFVKQFTEFLSTTKPNLRSSDNDLYNDLASRYNATVIKADVPPIPKQEDLEENRLVRARLIEPYHSDQADSLRSVEIVNAEERPVLNTIDEENTTTSGSRIANVEIPQPGQLHL